jgi:hypothetical protein
MDGKEAVRGSDEGQYRFNNALDALGTLLRFAPGTNDQVMKAVNKTNKVRKVSETSPDYVRISEYDEKRAQKAKKDRQEKAKSKGKEKVIHPKLRESLL